MVLSFFFFCLFFFFFVMYKVIFKSKEIPKYKFLQGLLQLRRITSIGVFTLLDKIV